MIHGSSNDPVLIKKIRLRIWTLRDEIEAIVANRLEATDNNAENLDINDLVNEYKKTGGDDGAVDAEAAQLEVVPDEEANSEEEGAESESDEESSSEDETPENEESEGEESESETEEEAVEATSEEESAEETDNVISIKQRRPKIEKEKLIMGTTLLSEVYMGNMFFFCNEKFLEGQSIVIEFLVPKKFIINADVVYCRPYSMKSRIISDQKLPYRCCIEFTFLKEGEKTLLRQFIQSVEPDLKAHKAPTPIKPKEEDDDFDLDELDL